MPIFSLFKDFFHNKNEFKKISFRRHNEQNFNNMALKFVNITNIDELIDLNVDESVEILHEKILECYNSCCPIITKTIRGNDITKPWITNEIKREIKKKQNLFILRNNGKISQEYFIFF